MIFLCCGLPFSFKFGRVVQQKVPDSSELPRRGSTEGQTVLQQQAVVSLAVATKASPGGHRLRAERLKRPVEALTAVGELHTGEAGIVPSRLQSTESVVRS